jgi:Putative addiction module component
LKELLVERLMTALTENADPAIERDHLQTENRRTGEIKSGRVVAIDGETVDPEALDLLQRQG